MSGKRSIDTSEIKIQPDENYKPKKDKNKKEFLEMLKKNEAPFIIIGAVLLICVLVYTIFSFASGPSLKQDGKTALLEERIAFLEKKLSELEKEDPLFSGESEGEGSLADRFDRFVATTSLKMSVLERRLENIEQKESSSATSSAQPSKKSSASPAPAKTAASADAAPPKKQPTASKPSQTRSAPVYHKIARGETYYSISRKYGLTVQELLDLNNLTLSQTIYPGQKILVKP